MPRGYEYKTVVRMLKALPYLTKKNGASIEELANALEITNKRDIERTFIPALESWIGPIEDLDADKKGIAHRWRLARCSTKTLTIPNQGPVDIAQSLEPSEWVLLSFFLSGAGVISEEPLVKEALQNLRRKIEKVFQESNLTPTINIDPALISGTNALFRLFTKGAKQYSPESEKIMLSLIDAIRLRQECSIIYNSFHSHEVKKMHIQPLQIIEHKGGLYLLCKTSKYNEKVISLVLERFKSITLTKQTFKYPDDFDADTFMESKFGIYSDEPQTYVLEFSPEIAPYIQNRTWSFDQIFTEQEDKWVRLTLRCSGYPEIKNWVMSFGSKIRVIEPIHLMEERNNEIKKMYEVINT